ncbi:MAG TPA: LptA/OstA family protein, partial [Pyrinomonadaceae bacterium]|nr:LptA/OstA family protein [Pyrinomonadaceae bacterium]
HQLENVHLEVYPDQGDRPDKISARQTLTNEDNTQFLFTGDVQIETRDSLKVRAESVEYEVKTELARVPTPVSFERENIAGRADAANLDSKAKRLDLKGAVEITVSPGAGAQPPGDRPPAAIPKVSLKQPLTLKSAQAVFDQASMQIAFSGGATAEQGRDVMSGETLTGHLNEQKRVKFITAHTNAYLRSMNEGHAAEVFADQLDFHFDDGQKLVAAHALRDVRAKTIDADSEAELVAKDSVDVDFAAQADRSVVKEMRAWGRPVLTLAAPKSKAADPRAANKRVTADFVRLFWRESGSDLERAEANGNADLLVEPARPNPAADRKRLYASAFRCYFYESGNLARNFDASGEAKAVVEPYRETEKRGVRTLTAHEMAATFVRETQDVERFAAAGEARFTEGQRTLTSQKMTANFSRATSALETVEAAGDAKFNELDRNGQSAAMTYAGGDGVVRLRGGEPVVWDSRARLKAAEIDSDTVNKVSYARGKVSTTYYSQEQTNGAAPFKNAKSPV